MDEVTGKWRRLHKKELCDLYFSSNIVWVIKSRRLKAAGHVARLAKRSGKEALGRPTLRWEDNIKIDLIEVEWGRGLDRSGSGWDR
jgi:hypothetical protein